jgi:hypothetical protein
MAVTNKLVKQVHMPVWELLNQAPTASQAISAITTSENGKNTYIYYLTGSTFYRYNTAADSWQQLATPIVAPVTGISMRYTNYRGYHARVLSATSTTIEFGGLRNGVFGGETVSIERGPGKGQKRVLTYVGETIQDSGVVVAVTATYLADSTKKWKYNQWAGYTVGITFGTDNTQYKKILYNDTTTLYVSDSNLLPHDPWNNQSYSATAPYVLPSSTAGAQTHYEILSQTYSVPAWTVVPDYRSFLTVLTGGIYLLSSAAAAPFFTLQYYDVAHDSWQVKTVPQGLIGAALGTDFSIERLSTSKPTAYLTSTATSGTAWTLVDTVQSMVVDRWKGYRILITGGTGIGQSRRIGCNTVTTFTTHRDWDIIPDNTSTYEVWPDFRKLFLTGNASSAMFAYNTEHDFWEQGETFDYGVTCTISCKMNDWMPLGVSTGVRNATGVQAVASAPTAGGSGYFVGDILTCAVGGAGAKVIVTSTGTSPAGVVTGVELVHSGTISGFTTGTGKATTGGFGTGCTINITAVGPTALITLPTSHWFRNGDKVTFAGLNSAPWNAEYTIIGVDSVVSFSVVCVDASSMGYYSTQTTTTLVDASKNWTPHEHIGKLLHLCVAGTAPTSQIRWITENTATTLTVATVVAAINGTSKYAIYDSKVFGTENQFKQANRSAFGHATGGSTTTLIDTSKNWIPNCWIGYKFRIDAGTGFPATTGLITITANSETTLTYSVQTFTPDATTHYEIYDSYGLITTGGTTTPVTDTTKLWTTNYLAGKRFRITGGTALGQETSVVSNTPTAITSGALTLTDTTSTYAVLGMPVRSTGFEMVYPWGISDPATIGRYIYIPRGGGSTTIDRYDLTTSRVLFGTFLSPQSETLTTGSSYSYDLGDYIYIVKTATGTNPRFFAYNLITNEVVPAGQISDLDLAATIGNRMEVIQTTDGLRFLYWLQNTGTKLFRTLLYYV